MGIEERFKGANIVEAGTLSPYWGEHAARYVFAEDYVDGARVLDIACGTGYGIGLLRRRAAFVVGVDVDPIALKDAQAEVHNNSAVLACNGLELPFDDSTFDTVTSFETLEHINDRVSFLSELSRVLRPNGRLILSTPNAEYTKPVNGKPANPFHVFEYKPDELREELEPFFVIEFQLGQSLDSRVRIPPFYREQMRLSRDFVTQSMLIGWKILNKFPVRVREAISQTIWRSSFYPTERDYYFEKPVVETAPVQIVVCTKR